MVLTRVWTSWMTSKYMMLKSLTIEILTSWHTSWLIGGVHIDWHCSPSCDSLWKAGFRSLSWRVWGLTLAESVSKRTVKNMVELPFVSFLTVASCCSWYGMVQKLKKQGSLWTQDPPSTRQGDPWNIRVEGCAPYGHLFVHPNRTDFSSTSLRRLVTSWWRQL